MIKEIVEMKNVLKFVFLSFLITLGVHTLSAQGSYLTCGSYTTDNDETTDCANMGTCCQVWNACNGPYSPCYNYDPDYSGTGGCDLSCAPIDSGILFLLLGGGLFGAFMISRKRDREVAFQRLD